MKDEQTAMVIRAVRRVTVAGMLVNKIGRASCRERV